MNGRVVLKARSNAEDVGGIEFEYLQRTISPTRTLLKGSSLKSAWQIYLNYSRVPLGQCCTDSR